MNKAYFALTVSISSLLGCAGQPIYDDPGNPPLNLAGITENSLSETFRHEMSYRSKNAATRRTGLALSGGGSKAGLFAHGILQGLNDTGLINQIDVVSATSGGNYPVYWYFTKHIEARKQSFDVNRIFDDCVPAWYGNPKHNHSFAFATVHQAVKLAEKEGRPVCRNNNSAHFLSDAQGQDRLRWQAHLARWPDLFETRITVPKGDKQPAPWYDTFWLGLRLLGEVPLTYLPFDSGVPVAYQRGIERTWGLNPEPRSFQKLTDSNISEQDQWKYTNSDQTVFGAYHVDKNSVTWESLQDLYRADPTLPLWVMNTMEGQKQPAPNMYNLYEVTPFSYGSSRHTYHQGKPPLESVSHGVRASAAFFDEQGAIGLPQKFLALIDGLIPAFTWGVEVKQPVPPSKKEEVRLSDGGGVDNLGLISLLRRGLDQIIVVDAAQDVEGNMKDLCWVRESLRIEGYTLDFFALENLDAVCGGEKAYNVSEWRNPVLEGEIRPKEGVQVNAIKYVKLFWIKAAWNEYAVIDAANTIYPKRKNPQRPDESDAQYEKRLKDIIKNTEYLGKCGSEIGMVNCWMPVFYAHNGGNRISGPKCLKSRNERDAPDDDCFIDFPQLKTVGATFNNSTHLFWAFRELGRSASRQVYLNDQGELTTDIPQCIQHAKNREAGRRPNDWEATNWEPCE